MVKLKSFILFSFAVVFIAGCINSLEKCSKYKTEDAKEVCLINLAIEKKDISICNQAPQNCLSYLWKEFPEEGICAEIDDAEAKDQCYFHVAFVKKAAGICKYVSSANERDSCIYAVSRVSADVSHCPSISNISLRDDCLSIATTNKTIETCNEILGEGLKANCILGIAVRQKNYEICKPQAIQFRDNCYMAVAAFHAETGKCSLILSPETRDLCISFSVRSEDELGLCSNMSPGLKRQCIASIAGASGKIGLCGTIESARLKDRCIRDVAKTLKDASHCKIISDLATKDECYHGVAAYSQNKDLCNSIVDSIRREVCFNFVGQQ